MLRGRRRLRDNPRTAQYAGGHAARKKLLQEEARAYVGNRLLNEGSRRFRVIEDVCWILLPKKFVKKAVILRRKHVKHSRVHRSLSYRQAYDLVRDHTEKDDNSERQYVGKQCQQSPLQNVPFGCRDLNAKPPRNQVSTSPFCPDGSH